MKLFPHHRGITINLSTETVVRATLIVIVTVLAWKFIGTITHELQLIATAAFLALALNPAVSWISQRLKSRSRTRATGMAYVIVLAILVSFLLLVIPPLVRQTAHFLENIPGTIANLKEQDSAVSRAVYRYNLDNQVDRLSTELGGKIGDLPSTLVSTAGRVGAVVISVVTVIVLTFMMLIEGPLWIERILMLSEPAKRKRYRKVGGKMYHVVTSYVNGQVLIALLAAMFALVALLIGSAIAQVSITPAALAGIIFMFGLIPLIGNTIGASIVVLICLFSSLPLAVGMAIFFLAYQQIENATLQPYIQSRNNQLTPLIVFISAIVGAGLGGILGAFVAIPLAGCLRILLEEYYGDRLPTTKAVKKSETPKAAAD